MKTEIFVYGTLLKGLHNNSLLGTSSLLGPAITGGRLYDLGSCPGLVAGDGGVVGELYAVDDEVLKQLDQLEGYSADTPDDSLYLRTTQSVRLLADGKERQVQLYLYNRSVEGMEHLAHGDYRRELYQRENPQEAWVLSYGSNMSRSRLQKRVGRVETLLPGALKQYRMVFNKQAQGKDAVYANVRFTGSGSCPMTAAKLNPEQIAILDRCEGVATGNYIRTTAFFDSEDEAEQLGMVYIAHPDKLNENSRPEAQYVAHIRRGYEEFGFDTGELSTV